MACPCLAFLAGCVNMIGENVSFTGTQIGYFFICRRKLWFFSNNVNMEHSSGLVSVGKFLHESTYERKRKEVQIGRIKIDFCEKGAEIHEVKKSRKAEKAHEFQLLYYLYYLKQKGLSQLRGIIDYPLLRKREEVVLTGEKEQQLLEVLGQISEILSLEKPPKAKWVPYCKKCSYREFCWS